jgi:exodeoxyribonuclease-3
MTVKLVTWNVNGVRACASKTLYQFLESENPDIMGLQEIKANVEQCAEIQSKLNNYRQEWHSAERPGYSGVMNLFRQTPKNIRVGCGMDHIDKEGRVLISDHDDFLFLNMYFPNGAASDERHEYKMAYLFKILKFFRKLDREKPLVLSGDFNIAHKAIDIHDPVRLDGTSGFKPEEREWMDDLVNSGFVDAYRHLHPNAKDQYSWWSYRQMARQRNKGWRIDYFFVSERIKNKIRDIKMHQSVGGSDHCPLSLVLDF